MECMHKRRNHIPYECSTFLFQSAWLIRRPAHHLSYPHHPHHPYITQRCRHDHHSRTTLKAAFSKQLAVQDLHEAVTMISFEIPNNSSCLSPGNRPSCR